MNNQDNRENNIVNPELVDLNKIQVDKQDNMLNRERSNIVSASIQANNAIDEAPSPAPAPVNDAPAPPTICKVEDAKDIPILTPF